MAQEINEATANSTASAAIETAKTLSGQAFSNPAEFLSVIKADFKDTAQTDPDKIFKNDLVAYADHGADPLGREAAQIAADHYSDLQLIADRAVGHWAGPGAGISSDDLQSDIGLMKGDTSAQMWNIIAHDGLEAVLTGASAIGFGLGAVFVPPLSPVFGAGAVASGMMAGFSTFELVQNTQNLNPEMIKDQQMIKSWLPLQ